MQYAGAQSDLDLSERRLGDGPDDLRDRRIRLVRGHVDRCGRWQLSRRAARRWLDVPRWRVDTTGRDDERRRTIDAKSSHATDRDQSVASPATRTARVHRAKPGGGHAGRRRALREWHVGDWRGVGSVRHATKHDQYDRVIPDGAGSTPRGHRRACNPRRRRSTPRAITP